MDDQSLRNETNGLTHNFSEQKLNWQRRVDLGIWTVLAGGSLAVLLLVLVPFYMTGGNVPSMMPGWVPSEPREVASIATFQGTIWAGSSFLQDAFWHVACFGWLLWVPIVLFAYIEMLSYWRFVPGSGRRIRAVILSVAMLVTTLWLIAAPTILSFWGD